MPTGFNQLTSQLKARILHGRNRYVSRREWRERHAKVFEFNPEYRRPCAVDIEGKHRDLWRELRHDISVDTLRVCHGISGVAQPEMVPEEVYVSEIEPCLNRYRDISYLANKNFYNRWFADGWFPRTFLHNIDGDFYDGEYRYLGPTEVNNVLAGIPLPAVIKPSLGPGGGRGVFFPRDRQTLEQHMAGQHNFVVQELIQQHPFLQRYNPTCLNTFRVCTYRSVTDNQVHVLNISMRMGKGGSLDNETAGGIVCGVMEDGRLNSFAVDKYGVRFLKHPDTGKDFAERESIPMLDQLRELARRAARDIYLTRLASLDACLDAGGRWRLIEINLFNQTIRFSQYVGRPFFGRFTREVVDYCRQHPDWR